MTCCNPEDIYDALRNIERAVNIEAAGRVVQNFLTRFPAITHLSLWGADHNQARSFFVTEFLDHPSITNNPSCITLPYDDGLLGKCAKDQMVQFITEGTLTSSHPFRDLFSKHGIRSGACVSLSSPPDYPCSAVVFLTDPNCESFSHALDAIKILLGGYLAVYAKDEACRFEALVKRIANSKVTSHGLGFLKIACDGFAQAFSATTFSVWSIEDGMVIPKYFSQGHEGQKYRLGQGLTGYVADTGKPILLHVLSDSERIYGVKWAGLVSDYQSGPPNKDDHIIIVPLIYPKATGLRATVNGILRFIGAANHPSFWPVDFERARAVADILSVLLYQENLLRNEEANSNTLKKLLTLIYRAKAADSLDVIIDAFLTEMKTWPGVRDVGVGDRKADGTYILDSCGFLNKQTQDKCKELLMGVSEHSIQLCESTRIWPVRDQTSQFAVLIGDFHEVENPHCATWLQLASQILANYYSINKLLQERETLIRDNEEKEMTALAGAVSRIYAHEVVNGCKALKSWIVQAQKNGPNYNALLARVQEMFDNVNELLNTTGFLKIVKRECVINTQLEHFLGRLGLKHGARRDGCEIRLDITGHKHRQAFIDPNTLLGIIHNLVINAQEQYAMNKRTGPIEIKFIEQQISDQLYAGFSVTDFAIGIPAELRNCIWDSGYTTKGQDGKGLGLAIVKRLVEECDGKVSVASTFGHYTTFSVLYPVANCDDRGDKQ